MGDIVGYRFRPTEEEMVSYYLDRMLNGLDFPVHVIKEVNINQLEPWVLPAYSVLPSNDRVWYFFTVPDYIDPNRTRVNRKTPLGYWKVTGKDRVVKDGKGREIGLKKTLVFHRGRSPNGVKTSWTMQEFHYKDATGLFQRPYVLCRLKQKSDDHGEAVIHSDSYSGNQDPVDEALLRISELLNSPSNSPSTVDNSVFHVDSFLEMLRSPGPVERTSSPNVSINQPNLTRSSSDSMEQDDIDFVNSLWAQNVDENEFVVNTIQVDMDQPHVYEGTLRAHSHDFNPVKSLSGYVETTQAQNGKLVASPSSVRIRSQNDHKLIRQAAEQMKVEKTGLYTEKMVQIKAKESSKWPSNESSSSNIRKGNRCFIFQESIPSNSGQQEAPSVYLVNIAVALLLLVFFVRELVCLR